VKDIYRPLKATVEKVITETDNIKTFVLRPEEEFHFKTGQFIEMGISGLGEAPFTPSSSPYATETIDVTIMETGRLTGVFHALKGGETVGIRGPYGKGYALDKMYGKEVIILGGGVGMAPLRSFLLSLLHEADKFKRIVLLYGSRTPADVVYKEQFKEWMKDGRLEIRRSVDKGDKSWQETVGLVTVLVDETKLDPENSVAIVCGPPIMMKFGTFKLLEKKFTPENVYLSMEKNMSCGFGKCGHCQIGPYFTCKDGPVFTYDQLKGLHEVWD